MSEAMNPSHAPNHRRRQVQPIEKLAPAVKERKGLRARSESTAERDRRYTVERREFLEVHPICEAQWDDQCESVSSEVHHMGGRARSVFWRKAWWKAVCHRCHTRITDNPDEAIRRGLSVRRNGADQ